MERIPDHPMIRQIERTGYPRRWYEDEGEALYDEEDSDDE